MRVRTPRDLGRVLRARRKELGLRQQALADRAGVSRQWVVEIERGKPRAELGLVMRLLRVLDMDVQVLAPGESFPAAPSTGYAVDTAAYVDRILERPGDGDDEP